LEEFGIVKICIAQQKSVRALPGVLVLLKLLCANHSLCGV